MGTRLATVGNRFNMPFFLIDGTKFLGQLLDIPDTSRVSNFLSTRRYLRTAHDIKNITPSDVMIADGVKFIIAEHGTGFYREPIYKHFKLFQVTDILPWETMVETKNTVTGIMEKTRSVKTTPVYMSMQPKNSTEDSLNIQNQNYVAVVNQPVAKNDILGGNKVVTKVDAVLGCWLIEMKDK